MTEKDASARDGNEASVAELGELTELREHARELIATAGRPARRVRLRSGRSVVEVEWCDPDLPAVGSRASAPGPDDREEPDSPKSTVLVASPLVGTFYRAPSPDADPYVTEGSRVRAGDQLGIVESMKLLNSIVAENDCLIRAVVAGDGEIVEFGQALFEVELDSGSGG